MLLGNYLTIRVQQHASGTANEVVAESTSVDCQFTAEAMEKTAKSDALTAKYEPGLCKINVSGDYLLASDAEQFTNLFTHANNGDKIEVDIYRSSTLVMSTEGVFTSLSKSGALSDSLGYWGLCFREQTRLLDGHLLDLMARGQTYLNLKALL
jgi:hypothetical protein